MKYYVMTSGPDLETKVVDCGNGDDAIDRCLNVVQDEGRDAPQGTVINMFGFRDGRVQPISRWAVGMQGLRRGTAYKRNPDVEIEWKKTGNNYKGSYEPGGHFRAEYMIDSPHRGSNKRPVFGRESGGAIELIGVAAGVAAAKRMASEHASELEEVHRFLLANPELGRRISADELAGTERLIWLPYDTGKTVPGAGHRISAIGFRAFLAARSTSSGWKGEDAVGWTIVQASENPHTGFWQPYQDGKPFGKPVKGQSRAKWTVRNELEDQGVLE